MKIPFISLLIITGILMLSVFLNQDSIIIVSVKAKLFCSFFLLITIFYCFVSSPLNAPCYLYARWIFFGMAFGFIGDLIMMKIFPLKNYLFGGIIVFWIGHLCYINAFKSILNKIANFPIFIRVIVPVIILSSFLWRLIIFSPNMSLSIFIGSLVYGILLNLMVIYAIVLFGLRREFLLAAIGAILFLISDTILGINLFRGNILQESYIFIFYIVGQWGIIMSSFSCRCQE